MAKGLCLLENPSEGQPRGIEAQVELLVVVVVTATIFVWGVVSARLEQADLTAPIVFTLVGALLALVGLIDEPSAPETLKPLVEITLVWVLFSDAARIRIQDLRRGLGQYVRMLAVGLPLTMLAGWGLAAWLLPDLGVWLGPARRGGPGADGCCAGCLGGDKPGSAIADPTPYHGESGLNDGTRRSSSRDRRGFAAARL